MASHSRETALRSGLLRLNRERRERPPSRLAADSTDDEPTSRIVGDFAMEGTDLSLRAELSADSCTLVLVALDAKGRATTALDGHKLVLEPTEGAGAPGRRVTFVSVQPSALSCQCRKGGPSA